MRSKKSFRDFFFLFTIEKYTYFHYKLASLKNIYRMNDEKKFTPCIRDKDGNIIPLNLQPAFDVLKDLNLDQYITEQEKRMLGVQ
jgi:hypothetical protein